MSTKNKYVHGCISFSAFNMCQCTNYSALAVTVLNSAYVEMTVSWKERTAQMSFSSKASK